MRGTRIGRRLPNPKITSFSNQTLIPFSTSSGSGGGRGRGGGRGDSPFSPPGAPGKTDSPESETDFRPGLGHGRGRPIVPASPILPSFSSFISSIKSSPSTPQTPGDSAPKKPIFFSREDAHIHPAETSLPASILSVLPGAGRGQTVNKPGPGAQEENRHLRARRASDTGSAPGRDNVQDPQSPPRERLSREEARKKALGVLSRGGGEEGSERGGGRGFRGRGGVLSRGGREEGSERGGGGRGLRGRGGPGRGRGLGRGRGRGRGFREREGRDRDKDLDDVYTGGLHLGDDADGEKLAKRVGPKVMNELVEAFEEMSSRVLPSPIEDAYLDAFHTNCLIEFEPEYLMEEFGTNPDIDEKPPIPLRDALEKMKPFLMVYEGIQNEEEWQEVMKETMERVPLLKEIVDYYSGPDRVTAKKQQEELERVAKTIPERAPASVKRFANRAVLSLQSNPGWGFDKKCQFMDKLAWEVSQHYK